VVRDGTVGTLAVAEAAGRFDLEGVAMVASPNPGGWVLEGEKHYVFDAERAREVVVAARLAGTTGSEGVCLFVVPQESLDVRPLTALDATRGYATVVADGVQVEGDRLLGEAGAAGPALAAVLQEAAVALAAEMVGTCQGIFDTVQAYVCEREQFGVKVGSFQAVKHKLANMFVALESARATAYFAAAAIAEADPRRDVAVAMAKASVGDCQRLMAQEGIQCLGGIGYTWEHDMHLFVKRAQLDQVSYGDAPFHRERIAAMLRERLDAGLPLS
jgi:alkylation response protein AidB-like acyl-CoA dehydrogenase